MSEQGGIGHNVGRTQVAARLDGIATAFSRLLGAALIVAVIVNVVNVVARYGFNHAITGADELQIYLMIGMAFLGGLVAHIRRRHLRMDVLVRHFPPRVARFLNGAEALLAIAVCGLMTDVSWTYTVKIFRIGSHSENAHIPMWMPHSVLAISFTLMTFVGLVRLFVRDAAPPAAPVDEALP
jgi:TRAP-type C4-dicarboxylate transport system permease small subunit